jgi:hypothetical protein
MKNNQYRSDEFRYVDTQENPFFDFDYRPSLNELVMENEIIINEIENKNRFIKENKIEFDCSSLPNYNQNIEQCVKIGFLNNIVAGLMTFKDNIGEVIKCVIEDLDWRDLVFILKDFMTWIAEQLVSIFGGFFYLIFHLWKIALMIYFIYKAISLVNKDSPTQDEIEKASDYFGKVTGILVRLLTNQLRRKKMKKLK